jgi:hypothetical protein
MMISTYQNRIRRYESLHRKLRGRYEWISRMRSASFVLGAVALYLATTGHSPALLFYGGFVAMAGVFVSGILIHRRLSGRLSQTETLGAINREGLARSEDRWGSFKDTGEDFLDQATPLLAELNIFGRNSLYQMIQQAGTSRGRAALADRIRGRCDPASIPPVQEAVRELSTRLSFRQRLLMEARLGGVPLEPDAFLAWCQSPSYLTGRRGLMLLHRSLVPATLFLMLADVLTQIPPFWIAGLLIQTGVFIATGERCRAHYLPALNRDAGFLAYGAMFALFEKHKLHGEYLRALQAKLKIEGKPLSSRMREFERINGALCLHYSILYPFINVLSLWDIHYLHRLEKWKETMRGRIDDAFIALAEMEALSSLAGWAHDYPGYAYPRINPGAPPLAAREMGHPLIPAGERITNSLEIPSEGYLALVTGSNMSGKSTFVRTVGINMILAFAGAPVAAREFSARPCRLMTCIQPQDSIALHVSHFYSEVRAVKQILEAASDAALPVLYLVDEIFSGTNTKERLIASRGLMLRLAESKSWGLITTHDLELVTLADQSDRIKNFHFRDEIGEDGRMVFPYRLHDGPIKSTNALKLLKREGIDFEDDGGTDWKSVPN